jgi:HK97 gp10 family phage protein
MAGLLGYRPSGNVASAVSRVPEVRQQVRRVAVQVRDEARRQAPKRTGAGARSIRALVRTMPDGSQEYRVTWDRDHFYMRFSEFGTKNKRARPFLTPAAERFGGRPS